MSHDIAESLGGGTIHGVTMSLHIHIFCSIEKVNQMRLQQQYQGCRFEWPHDDHWP